MTVRKNPNGTSIGDPGVAEPPANGGGVYRHLLSMIVLLFIAVNLACWICPLLVLLLFKWLIPLSPVTTILNRLMSLVYQGAVGCHSLVLFRLLGIRLEVDGITKRYPGRFYLVTANHQSWSDIFILQHLFNGRAPVMKFLVKRELIYMPLVGLICWAYDFPFLRRRSLTKQGGAPDKGGAADAAALGASLSRFLHSSATIMNFAEGTRYTRKKPCVRNRRTAICCAHAPVVWPRSLRSWGNGWMPLWMSPWYMTTRPPPSGGLSGAESGASG